MLACNAFEGAWLICPGSYGAERRELRTAREEWSSVSGEWKGAVEGWAAMNSGGKGGTCHQFCVAAISRKRRAFPAGLGNATARNSPPTLERVFPREGKET
jgi:hypothetical protein